MFIVENYSTAVIFCIITMICWGSWANTQKLTDKGWRFELFYWDYVLGIVVLATVFAFTLGSSGSEGRGFLADISQANSDSITSALIGGAVFNVANILLIAAIAIAGMSVAFPIGIGIALILGVVDNYIKDPIGNALVLFSGVAFIVLAILLNAGAYRKMTASTNKLSAKGLTLSVISGCLMGLFYGFVAESMAKDFYTPEAGSLTPYTAVLIFGFGVLLSNVLFNTLLMRFPFEGSRVSYTSYFQGSAKSHLMGILGGAIWCVGMSFSIIASGKAGAAISYGLGQGATIIAAIWGIFIWKEFRNSPKGTHTLLYFMLAAYVIGLGLIIASRNL